MRQPISPPFVELSGSPGLHLLPLEIPSRVTHGVLLVGRSQSPCDRVGDRVFEVKSGEGIPSWIVVKEADIACGIQELVEEGEGGALGVALADPEGGKGKFPPLTDRRQSFFPWSTRVDSK